MDSVEAPRADAHGHAEERNQPAPRVDDARAHGGRHLLEQARPEHEREWDDRHGPAEQTSMVRPQLLDVVLDAAGQHWITHRSSTDWGFIWPHRSLRPARASTPTANGHVELREDHDGQDDLRQR
jgi:hypothetical protein